MSIGKCIFKEAEKLPVFTVSCPPFLLTEEPMVRLSDLKRFLNTLELRVAPGDSLSQRVEVLTGRLDDE